MHMCLGLCDAMHGQKKSAWTLTFDPDLGRSRVPQLTTIVTSLPHTNPSQRGVTPLQVIEIEQVRMRESQFELSGTVWSSQDFETGFS